MESKIESKTTGRNWKRDAPILIVVIFFIFYGIFSYFWYDPVISEGALDFQRLVGFAGRWGIGLGVFTLIFVHARRIAKRQRDWKFSVLMFIPFVLMILIGFFAEGGRQGQIYRWWYSNFNTPIQYAGQSFMWFYATWAYFRTVRARNMQTLLFTGVFVLFAFGYSSLGNLLVPFASPLTEILGVAFWAARNRALTMTALGAGIAMSLRTLLGMERGWLGALGRALPTLPTKRRETE